MSGKAIGAGEGFPADFAGMTKNQLYDIMSQMKILIEQNKQQAREILIQNPVLTKALFQAQIMLGMVQPPQVIPSIQPAPLQQVANPPSMQQHGTSQSHPMSRKYTQTQTSSAALAKGNQNLQAAIPQPSHAALQPNLHHHQISSISTHPQTPGIPHVQLQSAIQSRPSSLSNFHPQYGNQAIPNAGFLQPGVSQHSSQPAFHGQVSAAHQPSLQSHFLNGGANMGLDFNNAVNNLPERVSWMAGQPEVSALPHHHVSGQSAQVPGGHGHLAAPAASLTPEMEHTLLQQVMSLTPEQISNLPPEQRHQVLQLQQMLRQKKHG